MKKVVFHSMFLFLVMGQTVAMAQNSEETTRIELNSPETWFDFWVGSWEASWNEGNGKLGKGTNEVTKILDGKVIQERFEITAGRNKGFQGTSLSVYQTPLEKWKQAWADNQGGYFDFTGAMDGDKRIFQTKPTSVQGKDIISRMVFKDIQPDSFTWDWESSDDGGITWKLNWSIRYERR